MPDDSERVEINGVSAFYEQPAGDPQLTRVEVVNRIIEQDKKTNSTVIALDLGSRHLPIQSLALVVEQANTRFTAATAKPVRRPTMLSDWCRGWIFLDFRRWFVDPSKTSRRKSQRSRAASVI